MIGSALFGKLGLVAIIIAFGGVGGMFLQQKVFAPRPEKLDYEHIRKIVRDEMKRMPEPTVSIQPFDVRKIKNLREFQYSPQFSGSVQVSGVDTAMVKTYIYDAVKKAFESTMVKYEEPNSKKRRR